MSSPRRSKPPHVGVKPASSPAPESSKDIATSGSEPPDLLVELAIAEQEAEELLELRRRELEEAQAAEWERWTRETEARFKAEQARREQLEVALGRAELQYADTKRRADEAERKLSQTRAEAEERTAQERKQMEEARSRVEAQLAQSQSKLAESERQRADVGGELEQTRRRLEGELAQTRRRLQDELKDAHARRESEIAEARKERDEAKAELRPRSRRKVTEAAARIKELEAQLEAERRRVADLEVAVELLEKQRATAVRRAEEGENSARANEDDTHQGLPVGLDPAAPQQGEQIAGRDPLKGWGVSIDNFPMVAGESAPQLPPDGNGDVDAEPPARRGGLLRRRRARGPG